MGLKFRRNPGKNHGKIHHFIDENKDTSSDAPEYDSTGLCLFKYDGSLQLIFNINNLFPGEYNQDARIVKTGDDSYLISYNIFAIRKN